MKDYNYAIFAELYDNLELDKNEVKSLNEILDRLLKRFKVKIILDMTCGTGAQIGYLSKKGYGIIGSDLSKEMLKLLKRNGFEVLEFIDISGNKFDKNKSLSILTVAKKIKWKKNH